ncbi:TPA: hypothetical protein ACJ51Q_001370 [Streptococcus suis]|uniref:hypothetical protein n=1 Tax=Streptococcus TaxID=1301 RepID=UPI00137ACED4|nr:hypothetical protein [Streptococcus suis]MCL4942662.1 hypothetical protein [Streptococcus suis]MCO8220624.1 hypothetical protein [Streptococcus suis]HEM3505235.1 hypothetical protein [Streptococcus suis]HEM3511930.1 hypothetical protein [Streptococcus suis]HEM3569530.1 hypothetical protein [Streptococcus suis]
MNNLEYMEQLFKRYHFEALGIEAFANDANKAKIKRLGIELRQAMLEFERKNAI